MSRHAQSLTNVRISACPTAFNCLALALLRDENGNTRVRRPPRKLRRHWTRTDPIRTRRVVCGRACAETPATDFTDHMNESRRHPQSQRSPRIPANCETAQERSREAGTALHPDDTPDLEYGLHNGRILEVNRVVVYRRLGTGPVRSCSPTSPGATGCAPSFRKRFTTRLWPRRRRSTMQAGPNGH
ncbi:hypothetical protein OH77DRAFT_294605 [Trametes cingulata]|nr:hypothetical protein OH77DRAFT_294605 [Trametes cingulata]